jgi:hypothetical protein
MERDSEGKRRVKSCTRRESLWNNKRMSEMLRKREI